MSVLTVRPVPDGTKIMILVSQKNGPISIENQYLKKIKLPMQPRHMRGYIGRRTF